MDGDIDFTTGTNWHTWNTAQLERIRNDNGNSTDNWVRGALMSTEWEGESSWDPVYHTGSISHALAHISPPPLHPSSR